MWGREDKRDGLGVTESSSWEEEDGVRQRKVKGQKELKRKVWPEWMSRGREKASRCHPPGLALPCTQVVGPEGAGPGPSVAHLTKPGLCSWKGTTLLSPRSWLEPPALGDASPGSLPLVTEAPDLCQCPDLISSSLESEEGPARKETC